jgi:hypothetical protein
MAGRGQGKEEHVLGAVRTSGAARTAAKVRTAGAILVLLLFWAALARSLWPELAPVVLQLVQAARGVGIEPVETAHLEVQNASRADGCTLNEAVARLEDDLAAIEAVVADQAGGPHSTLRPVGRGASFSPPAVKDALQGGVAPEALPAPGQRDARQGGIKGGRSRSHAVTGTPHPALQSTGGGEDVARIPVTVLEGSGPALSDGTGLTLFHDAGRIDLSTAPFFLTLLREGSLSVSGLRLFVDGGYAVYVVEEAGLAGALLGQSSDAWTALLCDAGTYVPLEEAWDAGLPRGEREMAVALRVLLEGGSFVRWLAGTQGVEAVQALRAGVPVAEALGMPLGEAESQWLGTLAAVEARPCEGALQEASPLRGYCGALLQ